MRKLTVIIYFLSVFLCGCTNNQSSKVLFHIDSLKSKTQQSALYLSYFYKDTLRPLAIYKINESLVYRLNVKPLSFFRDRRGNDSLVSQLLLDSTNNGGKTWSNPIEIFKVRQDVYNRDLQFHFGESSNNNFVGNFFIGRDFTKYIFLDDISGNKIYIVKGDQIKVLNPNEGERIVDTYFDQNANGFAFISQKRGGLMSLVRPKLYYNWHNDYHSKKHMLSLDSNYNDYLFSFSKDTLYMVSVISQNSEYAGSRGFLVQKIDTAGNIVETDSLPNKWMASITDSWLFEINEKYHLIGDVVNFDDSLAKEQQVIFSSDNFGKSWSTVVITNDKESEPLKHDLFLLSAGYSKKDNLVISDHFGSIALMRGFDGNINTFSDSTVYSDSIQKLDIIQVANAPYLMGGKENDTLDRYHYVFNSKILSSSSFGKLTYYKIDESFNDIEVTIFFTKGTVPDNRFNFRLYNLMDGSPKQINVRFQPVNVDSTEWKCSFSPSAIGLTEGELYQFQLYFANHTREERYNLPKRKYTPIRFYSKHQLLLNILIGLGAVLFCLFLLFLFAPYVLYKIYKKTYILEGIASVNSTSEKVISVINKITIVPLFVLQPRIADTWAKRHRKALIESFQNQKTVQIHNSYVPIPVRLHSPNGELIKEPSPKSLSKLFKGSRLCLEVIGPGGVGKTTLAVQIGLWTSQSFNTGEFGNHLWLPVLIEEETNDVFATIKGIINTYTNDEVNDEFLRYLLRKQRILVIVDALSERSSEMQLYIRTIYRKTPVNAMVLTSRKSIDVYTGENILLYPQKMDFVKVAEYVKTVLYNRKEKVFEQEANKSKISDKIVSLFKIDNKDKEVPILAVLPVLVMRRAILLAEESGDVSIEFIIKNLPSSIPEIFIDYITSVNPKSGDNIYSDEHVLAFCKKIAIICLGKDFRPTDFLKSSVDTIPVTETGTIIDRLIENGILLPMKRFGDDYLLRFTLDPIAEYLAGITKAKECGSDADKWNELLSEIEAKNALEFKAALEIVQVTYAERFGWWNKHAGKDI
ncbi:NB-ARC domain-containing protein [Niastella sp. OAS944]|uniref:NB-ARC domain-containing protein n=1 Tax=Niastella sp. OAS944 TaxID=2664089 RepID=UPI003492C1EB|nr:GTPase SAR1 family protein [Chitinophagaceae bacterium OAS944]